MAKQLKKFPKRDTSSSKGPPTKYPWDKWTSGAIWEITQGVDFDKGISLRSMDSQLRIKANKLGLTVQIQSDKKKGTITFRFNRTIKTKST